MVLDAGCGEGKNAAFFGKNSAIVRAVDMSTIAIEKARHAWSNIENISWEVGDVRNLSLPASNFDIVIAYGLLHCLADADEIADTVKKLQETTKPDGFNIICSFNDRYQELDAHPGFHPCLVSHKFFLDRYTDWKILFASDSDLRERHPHNNIDHTHSMTRLITQK